MSMRVPRRRVRRARWPTGGWTSMSTCLAVSTTCGAINVPLPVHVVPFGAVASRKQIVFIGNSRLDGRRARAGISKRSSVGPITA